MTYKTHPSFETSAHFHLWNNHAQNNNTEQDHLLRHVCPSDQLTLTLNKQTAVILW